jgi:hypothetical protein
MEHSAERIQNVREKERPAELWLKIGQISLITWGICFVIPQFITNIILEFMGVKFAFVGFYWLLYLGVLGLVAVIAWKYTHPVTHVVSLPLFVFLIYISFQYVQPEYWYFNFGQMLFNVVNLGILGVNTLYFLLDLLSFPFRLIIKKRISVPTSSSKNIRSIIFTGFIIWVLLLSWSYIGFSQTYRVIDSPNPNFRVGFWGTPFAGTNIALYNTSESQQEMELYQRLNATFIWGMSDYYFSIPSVVTSITAMVRELEKYNLSFIIDTSISFPWWNETTQSWERVGDYVIYYYTVELNRTIDAIVDWVTTEGFTNFRGISMDIEGPIYRNATTQISYENYARGKASIQAKLDEFKARFPDAVVNNIMMEGTMWDPIDRDPQLDVTQLTVGPELNVDLYGYMTYMTGSASLTFSPYQYAYTMEVGKRVHGDKFQPWIGWWYDQEDPNSPDQITNPIVFNEAITQFKIAKAAGVNEVILAPIRNYLGNNHTEGLKRLQTLVDIKENGFAPFEVPITNNMRLVHDFPFWWKKIHPVRFISNENIFRDSMMGTPGQWFFIVQIVAFIVSASYFTRFRIKT